MLMFGPPGTGKWMLAQRLPGILQNMSAKEILECSTIASIAGLIQSGKLTKNSSILSSTSFLLYGSNVWRWYRQESASW